MEPNDYADPQLSQHQGSRRADPVDFPAPAPELPGFLVTRLVSALETDQGKLLLHGTGARGTGGRWYSLSLEGHQITLPVETWYHCLTAMLAAEMERGRP